MKKIVVGTRDSDWVLDLETWTANRIPMARNASEYPQFEKFVPLLSFGTFSIGERMSITLEDPLKQHTPHPLLTSRVESIELFGKWLNVEYVHGSIVDSVGAQVRPKSKEES
jgi:hypothetical protein